MSELGLGGLKMTSSRKMVSGGLTLSNVGARLEYRHPVLGSPMFGQIENVRYDPIAGQTLVTMTTRIALNDMEEITLHE